MYKILEFRLVYAFVSRGISCLEPVECLLKSIDILVTGRRYREICQVLFLNKSPSFKTFKANCLHSCVCAIALQMFTLSTGSRFNKTL